MSFTKHPQHHTRRRVLPLPNFVATLGGVVSLKLLRKVLNVFQIRWEAAGPGGCQAQVCLMPESTRLDSPRPRELLLLFLPHLHAQVNCSQLLRPLGLPTSVGHRRALPSV